MHSAETPVSAAGAANTGYPQGLLLVLMNPPAGQEKAFDEWYDQEHMPNRLTVPGFLNGRRYAAAQEESPRFLAMYDLATTDVLTTPGYQRLIDEQSDRERNMRAQIPLLDRRLLRTIRGADAWTEDAPYQMVVAMDPAAGAEDDYLAWYADEHIPLLYKVPGWRRVRLFEQLEGKGPRYMALHEVESPAVFETDEYRVATTTPWRDRVIGGVTRRERWLFRFLLSCPRPSWGIA